MKRSFFSLFILFLFGAFAVDACENKPVAVKDHPCLILQKSSMPALKEGIKKYPLLKVSSEEAKKFADQAKKAGIIVPVPKDPAGGYTHIQHTYNYGAVYRAAEVYQLTGDKKYAICVRDMLLACAKTYPTLGLHPMQQNQSHGKPFWQGLNDSVWLVYAIQAYVCVFDFISEQDRNYIENNLFDRNVHFFTVEEPGSVSEVSKFHPGPLFADTNDDSFQIVAAVDSNCYKGAVLQRTMALVHNPHGRIGANDPNFNLMNEPGLLLRQKAEKSHGFFNVLEMHGDYNPAT